MCGIVGYVGKEKAAPILLDSLSKLEYRGYDSAGIAVRYYSNDPIIKKAEGKIINLINKTNNGDIESNCGIGHTRWATHGAPSVSNAHPHHTDDYSVIGVHNGIIENYIELKEKLVKNGYTFYSETDTEVIIKLVDYYHKKYKIGAVDAINKVMVRARGSYALAIMFKEYPNEVWFAKKGSPLIVAKSNDSSYLASDATAILSYTNKVYYVADYECGVIRDNDIVFYDLNGDVITEKKRLVTLEWSHNDSKLGNYPHFMIKEIEEQPRVVEYTINKYLNKSGDVDFKSIGLNNTQLINIKDIYILACGSAYHAGCVAQYVIEELTGANVRVELASEFKYRNINLRKDSLAIIVSQSGETKDTYEAMLKCKEAGIKTMAICNVMGSTITREADFNAYTYAGPEIAVATTKAYSCQLAVLYLFTLALAKAQKSISEDDYNVLLKDLKDLPRKIGETLKNKETVQKLCQRFVNKKDVFFIGRGIDYALCMEGSLKFKEITYIHSDSYAAGELKHGTISLITDGVAVVAVATQPDLFEKSVSNMVEVKSREGSVVALTTEGNDVKLNSKYQIYIPKINKVFSASLAVLPLQLLAYYVSVSKGLDPDKPRNLAKSVTVE